MPWNSFWLSLNSNASYWPVDAPEGTMALNIPWLVWTSASTVGNPLESSNCLAWIFSMWEEYLLIPLSNLYIIINKNQIKCCTYLCFIATNQINLSEVVLVFSISFGHCFSMKSLFSYSVMRENPLFLTTLKVSYEFNFLIYSDKLVSNNLFSYFNLLRWCYNWIFRSNYYNCLKGVKCSCRSVYFTSATLAYINL